MVSNPDERGSSNKGRYEFMLSKNVSKMHVLLQTVVIRFSVLYLPFFCIH
jgi:hypothetical protein